MGSHCCKRQDPSNSSDSILDDILNEPPEKKQNNVSRLTIPLIDDQSDQIQQPLEKEVVLADGSVYKGFLVKGVPHGKGAQTHENGDKYIGEFKNGFKNGSGQYRFHDGTRYVGEFLNGKIQGQGTMNWPNGDQYQGSFSNNIINGKGKYFSKANNIRYQGEYKHGKRHGKGELCKNDQIIQGEWNQGRFNYSSLVQI